MRKYLIFLIVLAMLLTFTGCKSRAKTLLDGDCIRITQEGARVAIYDRLSGECYNFRLSRKRPSETRREAVTIANTPTLLIEKQHKKILLTVKETKEVLTISIGKIFPVISLFKGGERI